MKMGSCACGLVDRDTRRFYRDLPTRVPRWLVSITCDLCARLNRPSRASRAQFEGAPRAPPPPPSAAPGHQSGEPAHSHGSRGSGRAHAAARAGMGEGGD
jgi:hypothetical protein